MDRYPVAYKKDAGLKGAGLSKASPAEVERLLAAMNAEFLAGRASGKYKSGGSFGGGGSTGGSWPPEDKKVAVRRKSEPLIVSRPLCINGLQRFWRYQVVSGNTFGPHNNGRFESFYGFNLRNSIDTNTWNYAGWQAEWNNGATGEAATAATPIGSGVPSPTNGGTGIYVLPPAQGASNNHRYTERYADAESKVTVGSDDFYDVTTGNVWARASKACSPWFLLESGKPEQPTPWPRAVAPEGTQPSQDEDLDEEVEEYEYPDFEIELRGRRVVRRPPGPGSRPPVVPGPGVPRVTRGPNSDRSIKVGKKQKEHKLSLRSALGRVWVGINLFTEIEDALRAMHDAMPKKYQAKKWQPDGSRTQVRDMLPHLYRHGRTANFAQAIENLVNNEIEDFYYGWAIGKPGKFINQSLGLPTGGNRIVSQAAKESGLPPAPKVDLTDTGVGMWWIDIGG